MKKILLGLMLALTVIFTGCGPYTKKSIALECINGNIHVSLYEKNFAAADEDIKKIEYALSEDRIYKNKDGGYLKCLKMK